MAERLEVASVWPTVEERFVENGDGKRLGPINRWVAEELAREPSVRVSEA